MQNEKYSSDQYLGDLKDFQRRTVDYVFSKLYGPNSTSRFLVADEVGLGKTLVARGIIAKAIEHLWDKVDRIDVIYICSNASIAKQNINRLNVTDTDGFTLATRLTYLPQQVRTLKENKINFISLTPQTTFEHTRSRGGHQNERAIIYKILYHLPLSHGKSRRKLQTGLKNMLQLNVTKENWRARLESPYYDNLDTELSKDFRRAVLDDKELYGGLKDCCYKFSRYRDRKRISGEDDEQRYRIIAQLRSLLANVCLSALEPDLVILDEFQRFKDLLDSDSEASELARSLFEWEKSADEKARILLLSATPYKMMTLDAEKDEDDHYPDFIRTLNFLFNDPSRVEEVKMLLFEHRKSLYRMDNGDRAELKRAKIELEKALLNVMTRFERISMTKDHNSMLVEPEIQASLVPKDLHHAAMVDKVARCVGAYQTIEYWKSAPYLISFLKNYDLRAKMSKHFESPSKELLEALSDSEDQLLSGQTVKNYEKIDPANPRMRVLFEDTIEKGMWQLLWMPPTMPYSEPQGVYKSKEELTKLLVFSAWNAVPDAIASLCSYEAERRMVEGYKPASEYDWKASRLLDFRESQSRLSGMPVIALMLPSPTLATKIDPLRIALRYGGKPIPSDLMKSEAKKICEELLKRLPEAEKGSRVDERWYWAAPILLERNTNLLEWCDTQWVKNTSDNETGTRFEEHIKQLLEVAKGNIMLGRKPDDLAEVLAELALAAPGTCALRALLRLRKEITDSCDYQLLSAASRIASGFRSLFNMPETIAMLRGSGEDSYWRLVLKYSVDGNIQSILDEYVHVLKESLGLQRHSYNEQIGEIAERIQTVLTIRTSQVGVDDLRVSKGKIHQKQFNTRCRFALRFGAIKDDNSQALVRAETVQDAFNSPFRPFILATTSIGQEGLDFHTWCHIVVHWNLPSNPVDLEQREGRVHRYKGHAIRKNIAEKYGLRAISQNQIGDPWEELFITAVKDRPDGKCDLTPFWIFEEGRARVERRIPMLPFSRETSKIKHLKQGLAHYRLVFGQSRQEDLLQKILHERDGRDENIAEWLISLEPPQ